MAGYDTKAGARRKPFGSAVASSGSTPARATDSSFQTIRATDRRTCCCTSPPAQPGRENALEGSIIVCDVFAAERLAGLRHRLSSTRSAAPPRSADGAVRRRRHDGGAGGFRTRARDGEHAGPRRDAGGGFDDVAATPAAGAARPARAGQGQMVQPHQGLRLRGARRRAGRHLRPHRDPAPQRSGRPAARRGRDGALRRGPKGLVVAEIEVDRL